MHRDSGLDQCTVLNWLVSICSFTNLNLCTAWL